MPTLDANNQPPTGTDVAVFTADQYTVDAGYPARYPALGPGSKPRSLLVQKWMWPFLATLSLHVHVVSRCTVATPDGDIQLTSCSVDLLIHHRAPGTA